MTASAPPPAIVLCGACRHYDPSPGADHRCSRWRYGYNEHPLQGLADIIVENDAGWGADMGSEFGCVLGELR